MRRKEAVFFLLIVVSMLFFTFYVSKLMAAEKSTYVGSKKCRICHSKQYKSWKKTLHPKKIQPATERTVIGDFVKDNIFTINGKTTTMSAKDGRYFITTTGEKGQENTYEIVYTIGSKWKQRYLTKFDNGEYHILPVQWNKAKKRWQDYHGLEKFKPGEANYWSGKGRIWQYKCAGCHVTGLKIAYNKANDTFNSTWVDNGAACESCHGPGSIHARTADKKKIVNPEDLNYEQQVAVCGQCHSRGSATTPQGQKLGYPYNFKPGDLVEEHYDLVKAEPGKNTKRFWADGESKSHHQQYLDFLLSKHYKEKVADEGVAGCTICHSPHGTKNAFDLVENYKNNELCYSCHADAEEMGEKGLKPINSENLTQHTRHKPIEESEGSRCTRQPLYLLPYAQDS
ncbi:MAG: hypothetical protein GXO98_03910 [Nitrospirae bacterium]|nr:hypothetical protein [Nitrospirota bacterium]